MTDDVRFSALRRKLLAGFGAAAIGSVTASAVGRAAPPLKKASAALWCRRSSHSMLTTPCSTSAPGATV